MIVETQPAIISTDAQTLFDALLNLENFKKLMPENLIAFGVEHPDTFRFTLKGTPEIGLKLFKSAAPAELVFRSLDSKLDFNLAINIDALPQGDSALKFLFSGNFNPMMAMMIKSPINALLKSLSQNAEQGKLFI